MLFPFNFAKNNILKQRTLLSGCTMHYNGFLNKSLWLNGAVLPLTSTYEQRCALYGLETTSQTFLSVFISFFLFFSWWTQPKKQASDRLCSVAAHNILPVPEGHSTPSNRRNKQNQLRTECLLPLCVAGYVLALWSWRFFFFYVRAGMCLWEVKCDEWELMLISSSWQ